jgi:hypothetical protein
MGCGGRGPQAVGGLGLVLPEVVVELEGDRRQRNLAIWRRAGSADFAAHAA